MSAGIDLRLICWSEELDSPIFEKERVVLV